MAVAVHSPAFAGARLDAARFEGPIERIGLFMLWVVGAISGFVFFEPAPYEFVIALSMVLFARAGLTLCAGLTPLVFLLILQNLGFLLSLIPVIGEPATVKWVAVSGFLSVTTLFFAAVMLNNTERRLQVLFNGYIVAAVVGALIAVLAYFQKIPNYEIFLRYGRAMATFKDPNVFGPFLILPALLVLQKVVYAQRLRHIVGYGALALLITAGLLLSFSRGAWGHFVFSALLMLVFGLLTSRSPNERLRIVLFAAAGLVAVGLFVVALLSIKQVADLFILRASLVQDYDAGQTGRFGGHILGALMALDNPFGIGPVQFTRIFGSEAHNTFITTFLDGGWIGGAAWIAAAAVTLVMGLRRVFAPVPWQRAYIAVYATFVGEVAESYIIDVHHWRHYYLAMGLVWGLMLARPPAIAQPSSPRAGRPLHARVA